MMVHNDNFLDDYNYIVLDEVHERDIESDFIMLTLKHFLSV